METSPTCERGQIMKQSISAGVHLRGSIVAKIQDPAVWYTWASIMSSDIGRAGSPSYGLSYVGHNLCENLSLLHARGAIAAACVT